MRERRLPAWAFTAFALVLVLAGAGAGVAINRSLPPLAPITITSLTPTEAGSPTSGVLPLPTTPQTSPSALAAPVTSAAVTFAPSVSHSRVLRIVTDLGLQTAAICVESWVPEGGDHPWFGNLLVLSTPLAPLGWLTPLAATPGVTRVVGNPIFHCPLLVPGPLSLLPSAQAGLLVRVTFTASTSYDAALSAVDDLGFQLANPCAEPPWQPARQEATFAATRTLLVATTPLNATIWQRQLQRTVGVARIELGPVVRCGPA